VRIWQTESWIGQSCQSGPAKPPLTQHRPTERPIHLRND
jgi:hypothetical protein